MDFGCVNVTKSLFHKWKVCNLAKHTHISGTAGVPFRHARRKVPTIWVAVHAVTEGTHTLSSCPRCYGLTRGCLVKRYNAVWGHMCCLSIYHINHNHFRRHRKWRWRGSALGEDRSCDGTIQSEGTWKRGKSRRNGPLTEKDGDVSARPATPSRETAAKGEKNFRRHVHSSATRYTHVIISIRT